MALYAQHVVVATGKNDWTSKIEDDGKGLPWGHFIRDLKGMVGRGGKYADPYNNVLISTSSLRSGNAISVQPLEQGVAVWIFPAFKRIWIRPPYTSAAAEHVVRRHLQPHELHPAHSILPEEARQNLTRSPELETNASFASVSNLRHPAIFICGHRSRDSRCGLMGPLLADEFHKQLRVAGLAPLTNNHGQGDPKAVAVGLISHIGGHKWAGNVIVYLPAGWRTSSDRSKIDRLPLEQARGIWYGRVEPQHVEGIIKETLLGGTVIEELFRGGVSGEKESG